MVASLLAHDGVKDNQRQGKLGVALHDHTKWVIRKGVDLAWMKYKPVHEYKQQHGYIKDHVAALDEGWAWVMSLYDLPLNTVKFAGFKGADDKNRQMLYRSGQMFFGITDEDSHWDVPILVMLKWVHEHWDRFERSAEQAYQLANFNNLYRDLLELSTPLPEDDGIDDVEINYKAMEKKLKKSKGVDPDGME